MIDRTFRAHPRSVGESYLQHLHTACSFGGTMIVAGLACVVHGIFPNMFMRTGSAAIERLHDRMVRNRTRQCVGDAVGPRNVEAAGEPRMGAPRG